MSFARGGMQWPDLDSTLVSKRAATLSTEFKLCTSHAKELFKFVSLESGGAASHFDPLDLYLSLVFPFPVALRFAFALALVQSVILCGPKHTGH